MSNMLLEAKELHTYYGASHILHGIVNGDVINPSRTLRKLRDWVGFTGPRWDGLLKSV